MNSRLPSRFHLIFTVFSLLFIMSPVLVSSLKILVLLIERHLLIGLLPHLLLFASIICSIPFITISHCALIPSKVAFLLLFQLLSFGQKWISCFCVPSHISRLLPINDKFFIRWLVPSGFLSQRLQVHLFFGVRVDLRLFVQVKDIQWYQIPTIILWFSVALFLVHLFFLYLIVIFMFFFPLWYLLLKCCVAVRKGIHDLLQLPGHIRLAD